MRLTIVLAMLLAVAMLLAATPLAAADDGDDPSAAETVFPLSGYPPSADDNVALQWNEEALQCIRVRREPPVVVARALFIVHASMYDAWASYDSRAVPLERPGDWQRARSHERTAANKREAVSHARARRRPRSVPVLWRRARSAACGPGLHRDGRDRRRNRRSTGGPAGRERAP